jgi:hypothetical protein
MVIYKRTPQVPVCRPVSKTTVHTSRDSRYHLDYHFPGKLQTEFYFSIRLGSTVTQYA